MKTNPRWMAIAVLLSLFLSGVAVGAVAMLFFRAPSPPARQFAAPELRDRPFATPPSVRDGGVDGPRAGVPPAFVSERMVRRLDRELELDPEQRDSVEAILLRQREVAWEELSEVAPRLRASVDSAVAQIRRLLGPEQRTRFDEIGGLSRPAFDRLGPGPRPER